MPRKSTIRKAKEDLREGKKPSTAAGEFVREEIEHVRQGKHGARSPKQAIAIGLSEARRAGIPLPPPRRGRTSEKTRKSAERAYKKGQQSVAQKPNPKRSSARERAMKRDPRGTVSRKALSRQARSVARQRHRAARRRSFIGHSLSQEIPMRKTGSKSKAAEEMEAEMEDREDLRREQERDLAQDLNQKGFQTGTHDTERLGVHWPPSYRVLKKKRKPASKGRK